MPEFKIHKIEFRTPPPDPLALFAAAKGKDFRAYWLADEYMVAVGETPNQDLEDLPPEALLIGGSPFLKNDSNSSNSNFPKWKNFQTSKLILPRFIVVYTDKPVLQIAARNSQELDEIIEEYENLKELSKKCVVDENITKPLANEKIDNNAPLTEADILSAISKINSNKDATDENIKGLEKVVLANCQTFSIGGVQDYLLKELQSKYQAVKGNTACCIFAIGFGDGKNEEEIFFGATPELLVKIKEGKLETVSLAGSSKIKKSLDKSLDSEFLHDPKELAEHRFVVDQLIEKLTGAGVELDEIPTAPSIKKLPFIQHLQTPISGSLTEDYHILDYVELLSPTSAVAGIPTQTALEFIEKTESFNRGWYSGSVGWCNPSGEGEFYVALRSALLSNNSEKQSHKDLCEITLFAGAGIVANSNPKKELEEIELKLDTIKNLIV